MPACANPKPETFDYTRIKCFINCQRKHFYTYVEGIKAPPNPKMQLGTLFHRYVELKLKLDNQWLTGADATAAAIELNEISNTVKKMVDNGLLDIERDAFDCTVHEYFKTYGSLYKTERLLLCEHSFKEEVIPDYNMAGVIDQCVVSNGANVLRDIKTTTGKLKYTFDDVKYNQQLLTYAPYAEVEINQCIDAIEIDEVRIAKLQPVPLTSKGFPSKDRKLLELVTLDDYKEKLTECGLFGDPDYDQVLEWMIERGHPLLNRIRVQLLDQFVVDDMAHENLNAIYRASSRLDRLRNVGPLCKFCEYAELCELDRHRPAEQDRQIYIQKILGNL